MPSATCSPGTVWATAGGRWALTPSTPALGGGVSCGCIGAVCFTNRSFQKVLPPGLFPWELRERPNPRSDAAFPASLHAAPSPHTHTDLRAGYVRA